MKVNFSELLASDRVGPLWGRSSDPKQALSSLNKLAGYAQPPEAGGAAGEAATSAPSLLLPDPEPPVAAATPPTEELELPDLADVPIEPPHQLFAQLEQTLISELGARGAMLKNLIEPLRLRIHRLDPTAEEPPVHPLRHAAGGSILSLINRLEDTLHGLRRVAGK